MPRRSCLAHNETVKDIIAHARSQGLCVKHDKQAGTVIIKDDDVIVYKGIQKYRDGEWIVTCIDSDRVKWSFPDKKVEEDNAPKIVDG